MRQFIILIILAVLFICLARLEPADARSITGRFKVSVTIPAVVGLNVPAENARELIINEKYENETTIEEVVRNNKTVLLKTTVAR